jgi:pSer/pThr/pTyr-binding forkhead associated (FHA) protein
VQKVTLQIQNSEGNREILLENELSIGRTDMARLVLDDAGLSRINSTFELHNDEVWVYDESSTNGTFVNGERIKEKRLRDGDEVKIGNETRIYVEISRQPSAVSRQSKVETPQNIPPKTKDQTPKTKLPLVLIAAVVSSFLIIFVAVIAVLFVQRKDSNSTVGATQSTPRIISADIPLRVIDPLGGEDPEDFDDAIESWETEENEINVADIGEIKSTVSDSTSGGTTASDLNVSPAFWQKQKDLAMNPARGVTESPLMQIPSELCCGVPKQKRKLAEMVSEQNYQQPMDFGDLAIKRLNGDLIEMPMATDWYVLEVGGSAETSEFKGFDLDLYKGNFNDCVFDIPQNSPKLAALKKLADNFDGQKYDLNNPTDRKQMRIRLLRMFNKAARPVLEELGKAYFAQFKRPLRVTSLTRSMDYQIGLNKTNPNSFKVTGKGSLPPHTSGCAFDLARKHMSVEEQNFMMAKLKDMENRGIIDSLREGGANSCFHTFIYADGKPPK